MARLIALGDSFTYGSELSDNHKTGRHSELTWPALLAQDWNLDYLCYALPGNSNSRIARTYWGIADSLTPKDWVVINWSWIDRWEYYDPDHPVDWYQVATDSDGDTWRQQRPGDSEHKYYWKYLQSERQDKWQSLQLAQSVILDLTTRRIPCIVTTIDQLMFDKQWNCPNFVNTLQDRLGKHITWFDGKTFLDWSKENNYTVSANLHPLEDAHKAAFEYMKHEFTFERIKHEFT